MCCCDNDMCLNLDMWIKLGEKHVKHVMSHEHGGTHHWASLEAVNQNERGHKCRHQEVHNTSDMYQSYIHHESWFLVLTHILSCPMRAILCAMNHLLQCCVLTCYKLKRFTQQLIRRPRRRTSFSWVGIGRRLTHVAHLPQTMDGVIPELPEVNGCIVDTHPHGHSAPR